MKLGSLFSDGAVFQRRQPLPVWGKTAPDTVVKASIAGCSAYGVSSSSGDFLIRFAPVDKTGGPHTLTVENISSGERAEVKNILFGEVWLASGQSNMEFHADWSPQLADFLKTCRTPDEIRMITVPKCATTARQTEFKGEWLPATAKNVPPLSAVALWFALFLHEQLRVPVGIIHSSWGGTRIEAWTSRERLMRNPELAPAFTEYEQTLPEASGWLAAGPGCTPSSRYGTVLRGDPGNRGEKSGWASPDFDDSAWCDFEVPGSWTERKLAGNGAVWIRRGINLPDGWEKENLILELGPVDKHDVTYINGVTAGATGSGFDECFWNVPRSYSVPPRLLCKGRNMLAIRAFSFLHDGAFRGGARAYRLYPEGRPELAIFLAGNWKFQVETDFGKVPPTPEVMAAGPGMPNTPAILFDGMIRPLIPFSIRGAIWYQGEENAFRPEDAASYERKMTDLIDDWRYRWGQGDFPFYMVQLANYRKPSPYSPDNLWPVLRENQRRACMHAPNTGMAVAIDCGDADNIHPKDKRTVGFRLARLALFHDYGCRGLVPSGPLPETVRTENGALRISFAYADGLHFRGAPRGFLIAGANRKFVFADGIEIDGTSVLLRSALVRCPVHVRYSWADNPDGNLYNAASLPASPFEW